MLGAEVSASKEGLAALKDAYNNVKDEIVLPKPPDPPPPVCSGSSQQDRNCVKPGS